MMCHFSHMHAQKNSGLKKTLPTRFNRRHIKLQNTTILNLFLVSLICELCCIMSKQITLNAQANKKNIIMVFWIIETYWGKNLQQIVWEISLVKYGLFKYTPTNKRMNVPIQFTLNKISKVWFYIHIITMM